MGGWEVQKHHAGFDAATLEYSHLLFNQNVAADKIYLQADRSGTIRKVLWCMRSTLDSDRFFNRHCKSAVAKTRNDFIPDGIHRVSFQPYYLVGSLPDCTPDLTYRLFGLPPDSHHAQVRCFAPPFQQACNCGLRDTA